ncbi:putative DDE superfamily endonuclease [Monocercomonoides exilis]|uniref:putative DDE superfamily endonuclease n=1 Tax=Monocercomonoides exilis TaxID=2049356 RepID=UPI0035599C3F|nr:putative DDE superfamily endonuclease [Monocercomonoides exilis]|eukprot:MONOS_5982.1-p1 / transcript=MONOS_5982.1 / gene=MONOS_5982 / organism=Monocercomonoides_exilis_PA203 / gene_product=unspecified product / transcript_product=unspecified product / location=Mono_scaffold00182:6766-8172(+) / protein_length=468 / sequence_SO=supercontig / SO=protein_coding / is_pseudo=false
MPSTLSTFSISSFETTLTGFIPKLDLHFISSFLSRKPSKTKVSLIRSFFDACKIRKAKIPSNVRIAKALNCTPSLVCQIRTGYIRKKVIEKKNMLMTRKQEKRVMEILKNLRDKRKQITPKTLRAVVAKVCHKAPSHNFHSSFIKRHSEELMIVPSSVREEKRMKISEQSIITWKNYLTQYVNGKYSSMIFCADESGYHDHKDTRKVNLIIGTNENREINHTPVDRGEKRKSLLHCISLDGTFVPPCFLVQKPFNIRSLQSFGYQIGIHGCVEIGNSSYFTKELFENWIEKVFIPHVNIKRMILPDIHAQAVLMLDGCRIHLSDNVLTRLANENILLLILPPNTTHLLQSLDLSIFSLWKLQIQQVRSGSTHDSVEQLLWVAVNAILQVSSSINIFSAFKESGLVNDFHRAPSTARIFEESFQKVIEIVKLDNKSLPLSCTRQTRQTKGGEWGIMNIDKMPVYSGLPQ